MTESIECPTCGGSGLAYPHPDALVLLSCWDCRGSGVKAAPVAEITSVTIPFDACICEGRVLRPLSNCWAPAHNLRERA